MNLLLILSFFFQLEILSKKCCNETAAMDSVVNVNNASTGRYARATNPMECQMRAQLELSNTTQEGGVNLFHRIVSGSSLVRLWSDLERLGATNWI